MRSEEGRAAVLDEAIVPTEDGPMRAILARPRGPGPHAPVIMFPHVGGLTETMREMAGLVAAGGYLCAVLDPYHRLGTIVLDPQSRDPEAVAIRKVAASSVTVRRAMDDAKALMSWLAARPDVRASSFGSIGYGRGGYLALRAAAAFPERIRAAASVLGSGFTEEGANAARAWLGRVTAGLYCAFAEHDDIIPPSVPADLADLLRDRKNARIVIHPGARHPYAFPDRAVHDPDAARNDWEAIFALFARELGQPNARTG
jgi:carboxymethylenebutenolidase